MAYCTYQGVIGLIEIPMYCVDIHILQTGKNLIIKVNSADPDEMLHFCSISFGS